MGLFKKFGAGHSPPVFRQRFKGLNASASTPAMRVELISQDRAQSRMHVGAGFEQGDVRAGSEQTTLYEIVGSVTIAAEQNREDSELWDRCQHALVSRRLCSHSRSVPAPGHPCGLWRNSAGVGKNVAGFVRTVLGLPKRFADGRAARSPRSDSGASVQGVVLSQGDRLFDESKIFVEQFLGLRAGRDRRSAIHRRHRKLYGHEGASHIGSVLGEGHRRGSSR